MRFNQFFGNTGDTMMAASDPTSQSKENSTMDEGPMVSNLPLLFANGYPTSLEKITMAQLERFVIFMVQCSLGHDTAEEIIEPQWWPKEIKFSNPLIRPKKVTGSWMAKLKKLVFRCYTYHRSEYLLRFCSCLARYPHEELEYVNNWDSTTSLFHKSTGKLLVTFRNENMDYDKKFNSPRKKLLSHNGGASANKTKQLHSRVMVQPPNEDIYLCDNCDGEFTGLEKMKEHERICCEPEQSCSSEGNSNSRPNTPDLSTSKPELRQDQFLEFFHLRPSNEESKIIEPVDTTVNNNVVRRTSQRVRGAISFVRCPTIPFSSPAGVMLAKKSKVMMTKELLQERLERTERHLTAPPLSETSRPKWLDAECDRDRWIVTHKPNREKPADDYVHQYRFVNSVKRKPTLSIQSQLLYIVCRPVYVLLTRPSQQQIDELRRDPSKYRCPIRKVSVRKTDCGIGNVRRPELRTCVPTKRKAPEVEGDLSVEDEEGTTSTTMTREALTACQVEPTKESEDVIAKPIKATTTSNNITVIDLCSSDEEDQSGPAASDENRDPMNSSASNLKRALVRKLTPSNACTKSCIYPADSTSDWLSENVLNGEEESYAKRYQSSVMLNSCAHLSPILRPAP